MIPRLGQTYEPIPHGQDGNVADFRTAMNRYAGSKFNPRARLFWLRFSRASLISPSEFRNGILNMVLIDTFLILYLTHCGLSRSFKKTVINSIQLNLWIGTLIISVAHVELFVWLSIGNRAWFSERRSFFKPSISCRVWKKEEGVCVERTRKHKRQKST